MAESLLAYLYTRMKDKPEDVATLSLQYILSQSVALNQSYNHLISTVFNTEIDDSIQYKCQVTGQSEEKERPDMAGIDTLGEEKILCEMKFYAGLTQNQPTTYLRRLREKNGIGLIFVCPQARKNSLWAKLKTFLAEYDAVNDYCIDNNGIKMGLITWSEILETLKQVATASALDMMPDIIQLEGFCKQIDSEAFIPFSAEDLTAEIAVKSGRYHKIIDGVFDLLSSDESINTNKKGPNSKRNFTYGCGPSYYNKYLIVNMGKDYGLTLEYNLDLWKAPGSEETPFWISLSDLDKSGKWLGTPKTVLQKIDTLPDFQQERENDKIHLALTVPQGADFDDVCQNIKGQVASYIEKLTDKQ